MPRDQQVGQMAMQPFLVEPQNGDASRGVGIAHDRKTAVGRDPFYCRQRNHQRGNTGIDRVSEQQRWQAGTALTGPLARRRQASNSAGHSTGESVRAVGSSSFSIGRPAASTSTKYTDLMMPPIVESACARA